MGWSADAMAPQHGRTFVVTGANSGIGEAAAGALAAAGARVILAVRNVDKGRAAAARMEGHTEVRPLDLASLASIRHFAEGVDFDIDVLINNAGVMALPERRTADGFEMQIGTNHLGHFALTGLLLRRVRERVVTVSSGAHRIGRIRFDDLNWERGYKRWPAYGQSKLANLLFMAELQRRLAAADAPVRSVAAHPGYASTHLQERTESIQDQVMWILNRVIAQSAEAGARPTLFAATEDIPGGSYVGPDGPGEMRGAPHLVGMSKQASDLEDAARLWALSEDLTGVVYDFAAVATA